MGKVLATILSVYTCILCILPVSAQTARAEKPLDEQTIVFLGDSITGNYQDRNGDNASIPYLVSQMTGATTYNVGFGGASMTERDADPYSPFSFVALTRAIVRNNFDLQELALSMVPTPIPNGPAHLRTLRELDWNAVDTVVIGFGANDYTVGVPLSNPFQPTSPHTLRGALLSGILTLQRTYPHLHFLICSVHPCFKTTDNGDGTYTYIEHSLNPSGHTLEDYTAAMKAVAERYDHPFADVYHTGITEANAGTYFNGNDGLHPSLPGQLTAAGTIVRSLGGEPVGFSDVPATSAHYESIMWAARTGVASGISDTEFGFRHNCTRAQALTFLWRLAGSPTPEKTVYFTDVPEKYTTAISWAVEQGITSGYAGGKFAPDDHCSRAQVLTFLWRLAGSPAPTRQTAFADVSPDAYYAAAISWAVEQGIASGYGGGGFAPGGHCSRAQIMTFLYRYAAHNEKSLPR